MIPMTTNQACCNLMVDENLADYRFIYYALTNSNFADDFLLSIEMPVFVDGNRKMGVPSMKRAVFVDGSRGYLLYLHDLNENLN